jgi:hypothetical protein
MLEADSFSSAMQSCRQQVRPTPHMPGSYPVPCGIGNPATEGALWFHKIPYTSVLLSYSCSLRCNRFIVPSDISIISERFLLQQLLVSWSHPASKSQDLTPLMQSNEQTRTNVHKMRQLTKYIISNFSCGLRAISALVLLGHLYFTTPLPSTSRNHQPYL